MEDEKPINISVVDGLGISAEEAKTVLDSVPRPEMVNAMSGEKTKFPEGQMVANSEVKSSEFAEFMELMMFFERPENRLPNKMRKTIVSVNEDVTLMEVFIFQNYSHSNKMGNVTMKRIDLVTGQVTEESLGKDNYVQKITKMKDAKPQEKWGSVTYMSPLMKKWMRFLQLASNVQYVDVPISNTFPIKK